MITISIFYFKPGFIKSLDMTRNRPKKVLTRKEKEELS